MFKFTAAFTIIVSGNIKTDYFPEERILMSSILHIAYPCFIKRLNYFLKDAVPEKNRKNLLYYCKKST